MVSGFFTSPCDQSRIFWGAASLMRIAPKVMGFGCRSRMPHRSFVGFSSRTRLPNVRSVSIRRISFYSVRLVRRGPSPATSCGSPRVLCSPRTAGPQPRDVLRLTPLGRLLAVLGHELHVQCQALQFLHEHVEGLGCPRLQEVFSL